MADSLAPSLLLSMPQLQDPNFARTVVLLCEHAADGAFGLVLNRPTDVPAEQAVRIEPPIETASDLRLWIGGPVEPQRGWILVNEEPPGAEVRRIVDGVYLSSSPLLLRHVLENSLASRARVLAGYAGWGPGQLDREIEQGSWILSPAAVAPVFDRQPHSLWRKLIDGALVRFARDGSSDLLH